MEKLKQAKVKNVPNTRKVFIQTNWNIFSVFDALNET